MAYKIEQHNDGKGYVILHDGLAVNSYKYGIVSASHHAMALEALHQAKANEAKMRDQLKQAMNLLSKAYAYADEIRHKRHVEITEFQHKLTQLRNEVNVELVLSEVNEAMKEVR